LLEQYRVRFYEFPDYKHGQANGRAPLAGLVAGGGVAASLAVSAGGPLSRVGPPDVTYSLSPVTVVILSMPRKRSACNHYRPWLCRA